MRTIPRPNRERGPRLVSVHRPRAQTIPCLVAVALIQFLSSCRANVRCREVRLVSPVGRCRGWLGSQSPVASSERLPCQPCNLPRCRQGRRWHRPSPAIVLPMWHSRICSVPCRCSTYTVCWRDSCTYNIFNSAYKSH